MHQHKELQQCSVPSRKRYKQCKTRFPETYSAQASQIYSQFSWRLRSLSLRLVWQLKDTSCSLRDFRSKYHLCRSLQTSSYSLQTNGMARCKWSHWCLYCNSRTRIQSVRNLEVVSQSAHPNHSLAATIHDHFVALEFDQLAPTEKVLFYLFLSRSTFQRWA
jgi:hypothetical protein